MKRATSSPKTISRSTAIQRGPERIFFPRLKSRVTFFQPIVIQPKLEIGKPHDEYEKEAVRVEDAVMMIPDAQARRQPVKELEAKKIRDASIFNVQKQDSGESESSTPLTLPTPSLLQSSTGPDFLSMRQPFLNRDVFHLWDPDSALQVWRYNFDFFHRFGLPPDLSAKLTNFTAPRFIDSQLKADNPTWWEITDRELNTSTISASIPLLEFNPDFSPVAPFGFRSIFRGGNTVQRKCKKCEEEKKVSVNNSVNDQPTSPLNVSSTLMQRKCSHCEEEEKKKLQRDEISSSPVPDSGFVDHYVKGLDGKGKSLPLEVRDFFEPRFVLTFPMCRSIQIRLPFNLPSLLMHWHSQPGMILYLMPINLHRVLTMGKDCLPMN